VTAPEMGLGAKPPPGKMSRSPHYETDWSTIRGSVFDGFCSQCL